MFAIIETGGKQYKVEVGSILDIERIEVEEGATATFDKVLLISDKETTIGTPSISGAAVTAKVVTHKRGEKIVVFKMKAKKRYQKTQGHRQELTTIEVTEIKASGAKAAAKPAAAKATKETPKTTTKKETETKEA